MRKAFLIAAMSSLVVSAAVGIIVFLIGEFGDTQQKLLWTTLAVGGFSLTGLASTARAPSWWLWPLRPIGLAASVVALGVVIPLIWGLLDQDEMVWKAFGTLCVVAIMSAHIALLGSFAVKNGLVWVWRSGAMMVAVGVAYLIIGAIWVHIDANQQEFYFRWLGVAIILDVLGTVGLYPWSKLVSSSSSRMAGGAPSRGRKPSRRVASPSR